MFRGSLSAIGIGTDELSLNNMLERIQKNNIKRLY